METCAGWNASEVTPTRSYRRVSRSTVCRSHLPRRDQGRDGDPEGPSHPQGQPPFAVVAMDAPSLEVDTTDGYRPGLDQIVAFVNGPA